MAEIVMALDGDTSCDNNMVEGGTYHFEYPDGAGGLLLSACPHSTAPLQAPEYFISIQASNTGLSAYNIENNISGGWDAGTAESLDMTMRIKNYFGRSNFRIVSCP